MSPLFIYKTLRYYIIYTLIFTCKYSCKMNNIYYSILKRILKRFLLKNGDSGDRTLVRIFLRCHSFVVAHHPSSPCKFLGGICGSVFDKCDVYFGFIICVKLSDNSHEVICSFILFSVLYSPT